MFPAKKSAGRGMCRAEASGDLESRVWMNVDVRVKREAGEVRCEKMAGRSSQRGMGEWGLLMMEERDLPMWVERVKPEGKRVAEACLMGLSVLGLVGRYGFDAYRYHCKVKSSLMKMLKSSAASLAHNTSGWQSKGLASEYSSLASSLRTCLRLCFVLVRK